MYCSAVRGHATSYSTHIDGIVLSVTRIMFLVEKAKLRAREGYRDGSKEDKCY